MLTDAMFPLTIDTEMTYENTPQANDVGVGVGISSSSVTGFDDYDVSVGVGISSVTGFDDLDGMNVSQRPGALSTGSGDVNIGSGGMDRMEDGGDVAGSFGSLSDSPFLASSPRVFAGITHVIFFFGNYFYYLHTLCSYLNADCFDLHVVAQKAMKKSVSQSSEMTSASSGSMTPSASINLHQSPTMSFLHNTSTSFSASSYPGRTHQPHYSGVHHANATNTNTTANPGATTTTITGGGGGNTPMHTSPIGTSAMPIRVPVHASPMFGGLGAHSFPGPSTGMHPVAAAAFQAMANGQDMMEDKMADELLKQYVRVLVYRDILISFIVVAFY